MAEEAWQESAAADPEEVKGAPPEPGKGQSNPSAPLHPATSGLREFGVPAVQEPFAQESTVQDRAEPSSDAAHPLHYVAHYVDPYEDESKAESEDPVEAVPHADAYDAYIAAYTAAHTRAYAEAENHAQRDIAAAATPAAAVAQADESPVPDARVEYAESGELVVGEPAAASAEPGPGRLAAADGAQESGPALSAFEYLMSFSRPGAEESPELAQPEAERVQPAATNGESAAARFESLLKSDWNMPASKAPATRPEPPAEQHVEALAMPRLVAPAERTELPANEGAIESIAAMDEATATSVTNALPARSLLLEEPARATVEAAYEEAPDLLRWRAEMLLDEMMVGAVDVSAGEGGTNWLPLDTPTDAETPYAGREDGRGPSAHAQNGAGKAGRHGSGVEESADLAQDYDGAPARNGASGRAANGGYGATSNGNGAGGDGSRRAPVVSGSTRMPTPIVPGGGRATPRAESPIAPAKLPVAATPELEPWQPAVYQGTQTERSSPAMSAPAASVVRGASSSEPLHTQAARAAVPLAASSQPVAAPAPAARRIPGRDIGAVPEQSLPAANAGGSFRDAESGRKLTAVEKRYPRSSRAQVRTAQAAGLHHDGELSGDDDYAGQLGPIRRNPAVISNRSVAGAMNVVNRNSAKYASLLPRSTPWDEHEMAREITSLSDEMGRVLPHNHDSSRRARHLLEKAQTIFDSDPLRSAEVDYYLSQVRSIVQRSRQTMQWSGMYRQKLMVYLWAWILLSTAVVVGALLYGQTLRDGLAVLAGAGAEGQGVRNLASAAIAMFGGSLGGALGAMLNLRRYQRLEIGYIDRKYGLLGLVLPLIGFAIGLVFFAVIGAALWLVGSTASWPLYLELIPAVLAFLYGVVQESIYGTRD